MTTYPRPKGVTVVLAGGEIIPIELAFAGLDDEGRAIWESSTEWTCCTGTGCTCWARCRRGAGWRSRHQRRSRARIHRSR